jgi:hypothetical protein
MANSYKRLGFTGSGAGGGSSFVKDPVSTLPQLPSLGNTAGDLRYVNSVDQWYQWNGGSWESWTTYLTSDTVLITDTNKLPISSGITALELSRLTGVSSNIQDQLDVLESNSFTFNNTTSWDGPTSGKYTFTVLYTTHEKLNPIVEAFELNGSDYDLVFTEVSIDSTSSNITISVSEVPDLRFSGKITIS